MIDYQGRNYQIPASVVEAAAKVLRDRSIANWPFHHMEEAEAALRAAFDELEMREGGVGLLRQTRTSLCLPLDARMSESSRERRTDGSVTSRRLYAPEGAKPRTWTLRFHPEEPPLVEPRSYENHDIRVIELEPVLDLLEAWSVGEPPHTTYRQATEALLREHGRLQSQ